jgi:hypothetical protein
LAFKLLLTLSVSQVSCERSFSKLKLLKTSIRSTLSQQNLETLMLMSIKKAILMDLDNNDIMNMNLGQNIQGQNIHGQNIQTKISKDKISNDQNIHGQNIQIYPFFRKLIYYTIHSNITSLNIK